jgi:predicted CDP-diglyceride synthetase/phosphatidate cytidylyltransferase
MNRILTALFAGLFAVFVLATIATYDMQIKQVERQVSDLQHQVNTLNQWYAECQRGIEIE